MKSLNGCAVACGALGEARNAISTPKTGGRGFDHMSELMKAGPFKKQRTGLGGHPSYDRPLSHLCLGNEAHTPVGVQDEYVRPGDVVGNEQHRRYFPGGRLTKHGHTDRENVQDFPAPALDEQIPAGRLDTAENKLTEHEALA
jgi:hypothetical protein